MKIVHVNTSNKGGGAEVIASSLVAVARAKNYVSEFYVGRQKAGLTNVKLIAYGWLDSFITRFHIFFGARITQKIRKVIWKLSNPGIVKKLQDGAEDIHYPSMNFDKNADIIHLHNLHGGYFDLPSLPELSLKKQVIITAHDQWLMTGHCGYSLDCTKWKSGCGECPYLDTYPAIKKDRTAQNWLDKAEIYKQSKIHLVTPSQYLMDEMKQSILWPAVQSHKVIHNGIDTNFYHPDDDVGQILRRDLNIKNDDILLLTVANNIHSNPFKDFKSSREIAVQLGQIIPENQRVYLLVVGSEGITEHHDNTEIRYMGYVGKEALRQYYQAADFYLHTAKNEIWGLTITEAMACGCPPVAFDVGGIREQIIDYKDNREKATGALIKDRSIDDAVNILHDLSNNKSAYVEISKNTRVRCVDQFDISVMSQAYLDFYEMVSK